MGYKSVNKKRKETRRRELHDASGVFLGYDSYEVEVPYTTQEWVPDPSSSSYGDSGGGYSCGSGGSE